MVAIKSGTVANSFALCGALYAQNSRIPSTVLVVPGAIVPVNDAVLHDEENVLGLANIFDGIARDCYDVGDFTGLQRAKSIGKA